MPTFGGLSLPEVEALFEPTSERDIYLNNDTGDDNNDGLTAATALFTEQKAADVAAAQLNTERTNIHYANTGIPYDEEVVIPSYAKGEIRIVGDLSTPANIVKRGQLSTFSIQTAFTHEYNSATLTIEGITIDDFFRGVGGARTRTRIGGVAFTNMGRAVDVDDQSTVEYFDNGSYNTTFAGHPTIQIGYLGLASNKSTISCNDTIVATDVYRAFNIQTSSDFVLGSSSPLDITHYATGLATITFFLGQRDCRISISSDVTVDGNRATPTGAMFFFGDGFHSTFFLGGITFTIEDINYIYQQGGQGEVYFSDDDSITYTKTNVNNDFKANVGSTAFDDTSLIATGVGEFTPNGFDTRLELQKQLTYFSM